VIGGDFRREQRLSTLPLRGLPGVGGSFQRPPAGSVRDEPLSELATTRVVRDAEASSSMNRRSPSICSDRASLGSAKDPLHFGLVAERFAQRLHAPLSRVSPASLRCRGFDHAACPDEKPVIEELCQPAPPGASRPRSDVRWPLIRGELKRSAEVSTRGSTPPGSSTTPTALRSASSTERCGG